MENLERISGLDKIIRELPKEYRHWHLFGTILKLEYERAFDYQKWTDNYNVKLLVTDEKEKYKIFIFLKNVTGEISFVTANKVSGFAIKDRKKNGYENDNSFLVYDFENGDLSIYCEEIEVELLGEPLEI